MRCGWRGPSRILETEALIYEVRQQGGDEDPGRFRQLFKRKVGLTPAHYRRKCGGIGGMPPPVADGRPARPPAG